MKHLFADYDVSLLVKEKGYNKQCLAFYNGKLPDGTWSLEPIDTDFINFRKINSLHVSAPLWDQIIEWLREVHNIEIVITGMPIYGIRKYRVCLYRMIDNIMTDDSLLLFDEKTDEYKGYQTFTYPEARRTAILHALTLI